jgi:hypothetical protein
MDRGLNRCDFGPFQTDSKDLIASLLLRLPVAGPLSKGRTLPSTFHDEMGRSKMKKRLFEVTPLAAIASLVLSGAAWAGNTDDFGCSNATLKGEYAFGVTVYTPAPPPSPPPTTVVVNGIKVFDGRGNLTQRDYQGDNLAGPDFAPQGQEKGTYQVNSDCTGSMVINLNVPNVPAGLSSGVIDIMFVISDGGRHIHEVVSQFTPPFQSAPVPTQTSADDWKVASERGD